METGPFRRLFLARMSGRGVAVVGLGQVTSRFVPVSTVSSAGAGAAGCGRKSKSLSQIRRLRRGRDGARRPCGAKSVAETSLARSKFVKRNRIRWLEVGTQHNKGPADGRWVEVDRVVGGSKTGQRFLKLCFGRWSRWWPL